MNEDFKRLKRWVEECPVEATMRIEELERKLALLGEDWSKIIDERNKANDVARYWIKESSTLSERYEKAIESRKVCDKCNSEIRKLLEE